VRFSRFSVLCFSPQDSPLAFFSQELLFSVLFREPACVWSILVHSPPSISGLPTIKRQAGKLTWQFGAIGGDPAHMPSIKGRATIFNLGLPREMKFWSAGTGNSLPILTIHVQKGRQGLSSLTLPFRCHALSPPFLQPCKRNTWRFNLKSNFSSREHKPTGIPV